MSKVAGRRNKLFKFDGTRWTRPKPAAAGALAVLFSNQYLYHYDAGELKLKHRCASRSEQRMRYRANVCARAIK